MKGKVLLKMVMTNEEKNKKANESLSCILNGKTRELSELIFRKISLVDSIESIDFRAINKKNENKIYEYEALLTQKEEAERQLELLIDDIVVQDLIINALRIGIEKINKNSILDEPTDQVQSYSNKVVSRKKSK